MKYDIAVIGAGIAGAGIAAELAPHASVIVLEAEDMPGYHSTGRSAAFWHETLGGPVIQQLSKASHTMLAEGGFLSPRQSLEVAQAGDEHLLDALETKFLGTGARLRRLSPAEVRARIPRASPALVAGLIEEDCSDIDVAALHESYLSAFRKQGGTVETRFRADSFSRTNGLWRIGSGDRAVEAAIVVNASGAWADTVAQMAGAAPLGLQPMRRTIAQVRVDGDDVPADLPLVMDIAGKYYFKPEGPNRLWVCPHDETPTDPCDAAPEEIDVATAIYWFETVTDWRVLAVERKWAGLRTFAPDRMPVYGFDTRTPGFFWCAGQGGVGIQTAPAASRMAAALVLGHTPDIVPAPFTPARFIL